MMKVFSLASACLLAAGLRAQTTQQLLDSAAAFPAMPRDAAGLLLLNGPAGGVTFGSGTPYNDLEYTAFDTDYMEGETNGYDTFYPVDPSDSTPGADRVKYLRGVNNLDLESNYDGANGDRYILGTAEYDVPFFLRGADGRDDDYVSIQNFDFNYGHIQLQGGIEDYDLVYCGEASSCETEGYYLFYTKDEQIDLVAFIFPCYDLGTTVSGNTPQDSLVLCNGDSTLALDNETQFRFAEALPPPPTLAGGVVQFGTNGKEIVGGITTDQAGNTYTFGCSDGSLGGGPRTGHQLFVVKHSPAGEEIWTYTLTQPNGALFFDGIADDAHLYVVGRTLGALPGFTSGGRWDAIILKLDLLTGTLVAGDQSGNTGLDGYGNVTFDDAGHLLLSGQGGPAGVTGTDPDYMIAKYDRATLTNVWRVYDAPSDQPVFVSEAWGGISYLPGDQPGDGSMVVAGWYMTLGGANGFVTKYGNLTQTEPTVLHTATIESPGVAADWVLDNVQDDEGNIYVAGYTTGRLQGTHLGDGDAYVAKYSPQLTNPQFVQFGTAASDNLRKLEIDPAGNLYATGYTYGDFEGENLDDTGLSGDVLVVKLDADLNVMARQQIGTAGEDRGYVHLRDTVLYVGGMTEAALVGASQGSFDGFVAALSTNDLSVVLPTPTSSPREVAARDAIHVSPNPTRGAVFLTARTPLQGRYAVYNALGQPVAAGPLSGSSQAIDLASVQPGLYFVRVVTATQTAVVRVVRR